MQKGGQTINKQVKCNAVWNIIFKSSIQEKKVRSTFSYSIRLYLKFPALNVKANLNVDFFQFSLNYF